MAEEATNNRANHRPTGYEALDERVSNLRASVTHIEQSMGRGFDALTTKIAELSANSDKKIADLANAISDSRRAPWATLISGAIFIVTVLGLLIGMLYWPIRGDQSRAEATLVDLQKIVAQAIKDGPDVYVPRREIETSRARATEDRAIVNKDIDTLRTSMLPRNEWLLRNAAVDSEFADLRRTLEQVRQDFGGTYNLRDALKDLQGRIDDLEHRLTTKTGGQPS
jgi:DNA repair exonuclease SbcCD ATPase subunit